jgi:RNA polymerase sigma factor (sigma-70 family)
LPKQTLSYITSYKMSDTEILQQLKENKYSKALKGLYNIFPAIQKYIIQNSGTKNDAEDVFQDALVVLYRKANDINFTLTVSLKTYMEAIAKNLWMQELRRQKKIPIATQEIDLPEISIDEELGFGNAETAFKQLGEKCKALLTLFYFKKMNYKDIATTLAFNDENVAKNQKYRCLQKAKENYLTITKNNTHG